MIFDVILNELKHFLKIIRTNFIGFQLKCLEKN